MLFYLAMAGELAGASSPTVTNAQCWVADPGVCSIDTPSQMTTPATVRLAWTITNADPATFETWIYKDGVLWDTLTNTTTQLDQVLSTVLGGREGVARERFAFRVDVVRKSDGHAVSSATANVLEDWFGRCS